MSLRAKTVWLLLGMLVVFSAVAYAIHYGVVIPSFVELEAEQTEEDLRRVLDALARERHHLDVLANDWAAWDDTYEFVGTPNDDYRESNLNAETFAGTQIDLIQILDVNGQTVGGARVDSDTGETYTFAPLPEEGLPLNHPLLARRASNAAPLTGILVDDERAMILAARPIVRSDRSGPVRGVFVMGRFADQRLLDSIADQTRITLQGATIGTDVPLLAHTPAEWVETHGRGPSLHVLDEHRLAGLATVDDLFGATGLVLLAELPRPIVAAGRDLAGLSIPLIALAALVVVLLLAAAITSQVIRPTSRLTGFVAEIEAGGSLSARIALPNGRLEDPDNANELDRLARGINGMLQTLEAQAIELDDAVAIATNAADARSAFLARMSHELRTPLHGILGMTTLLMKGGLSPEQERQAKTVLDSGELLLTIINEVLDVSKIEADKLVLEKVSADLYDVVDRTITLIRSAAHAKAIQVTSEIDPSVPPRLRADPVRLRQVLNNLLGNAVKFTEQGEVRLEVVVTEESSEALRVRFEVTDTGEGIPDDQLSVLFDAFTQARGVSARREGTGLGLTISKHLVELMDGTIGVKSVYGTGSTFWFEVPFDRVDPDERTRTDVVRLRAGVSAKPKGDWRRFTRILVADDNVPSRQFAIFLLEGEGFLVDAVANGALAVEAVQNKSYDLVLMDSRMPVMTGFEATAAIRALPGEAGTVPIIAVTAEAMRGDYDACLGAGMNDYVAKPIDADYLLSLVARYCQPAESEERLDLVAEGGA